MTELVGHNLNDGNSWAQLNDGNNWAELMMEIVGHN